MSDQFQKVHHPPLLPITDRFKQHQYCLRCLSVWCLFVLDDLWNAMECFRPPSLFIGKVWVPVMHFCACPIHCKVHWRVGRRQGSCRLISVQPSMGSTIRVLSICSALWVLEVLCCLYWYSFYQTDHIRLWWMVVGVNWLTLYKECRRAVFWVRYCSSCTLRIRSVFHSGKQTDRLCWWLHFDGCFAIPRRLSYIQ